MQKLILIISLALLALPTHAPADATSQWTPLASDAQALAKSVLSRSNIISDFLKMINTNFKNSDQLAIDDIKVIVDNNGAPAANIDRYEISIPYEYLIHATKSHTELEESRDVALKRGLDTVEYTLYHVWAHLITDDLSPDNDDTAEAVSTWLMINAWPNGGEQWFEDAQAFGRASQLLDGPLNDYWHAHSLYKSRNSAINCWILGSNPEQYEPLLKATFDPAERRQECVSKWQQLDASMRMLLTPMLKPDAPLLK